MGKSLLLVSYFFITPLFIFFSILVFSFITFNKNKNNNLLSFYSPSKSVAFAALPSNKNFIEESTTQIDSRVEMVRQFFAKYNSPLEPFAKDVISVADNYNIDFRLIPSIAMQESNLCKKIPKDSYNCWGFGIYGGKVTRFESYPQAIETITKTLANKYKRDGLHSPEEIMQRYAPSNNGEWAKSVSHFMSVLQ
ncbi:MAG: hypothetical protein Q7K55_00145 [Candidatus Levybacteria bacterium]|nr:hypothetical protein [Candidatus Levybacteria bacterium]